MVAKMAFRLNVMTILLTGLLVASCINTHEKINENFGKSVNQALDNQKIKNAHSPNDAPTMTYKEVAKDYKDYIEGKSVQSSSSNSLSGSSTEASQ
ncbi:hypothetical protein MCEZLEM10_00301 [Methylophilaceae bacterium]